MKENVTGAQERNVSAEGTQVTPEAHILLIYIHYT